MKKIFTLLAFTGVVAVASAQSFKSESKKPVQTVFSTSHDTKPGYNDFSMNTRNRDFEIAKIRREFDQKILSVKRDWRLNTRQRSKQIQKLEKQRDQQIRMVYERYSKFDRHDDRGHGRW